MAARDLRSDARSVAAAPALLRAQTARVRLTPPARGNFVSRKGVARAAKDSIRWNDFLRRASLPRGKAPRIACGGRGQRRESDPYRDPLSPRDRCEGQAHRLRRRTPKKGETTCA